MIGDHGLGPVESVAEFLPEAAYQHSVVHFYRNALCYVPSTKDRLVATTLKAIHASEDRDAAWRKAFEIVGQLRELKLPAAV